MNRPATIWSLLAVCFLPLVGLAQDSPSLSIVDQLNLPGLSDTGSGEKVAFSGQLQVARDSRQGRLSITAKLEPNWHVYSLTQLPGGPMRSELKVSDSADFEVVGPFEPDEAPHISTSEFFSVPIEEHSDEVIWTAPIRLSEGVSPEQLMIEVTYSGQVCMDDGACIPISKRPIPVAFAGYYDPPAEVTEPATAANLTTYRGEGEHVQFTGTISPRTVQPGGTFTLTITAELDPQWHIYAYAERDPQLIAKPTLIATTPPPGWQVGAATASEAPIEHETGLDEEPISLFHEGAVSWSIPIQVPADAAPGDYSITGVIGYQTCTLISCDLPAGVKFRVAVGVGQSATAADAPVNFTGADYSSASKLSAAPAVPVASEGDRAPAPDRSESASQASSGFDKTLLTVSDDTKERPIWIAMAIALGGGFILNFMPCVLPVIGLKVMSFIQQAGESRARAFALNLWYTLGLLSVFMILATMAAVWSLGWGQQNQSTTFNIVMVSVVFTMGLSFLGVWEIPIPGFVGTGTANELQAREGVAGAFAKGVITTILAVPCSGPLVATALTWSAGKPPALVYLTFACMGLGMAAPYLAMGAFPGLMRFMPKPGAWMDTFKQVMGFVLLGTVIWIMSYLPWPFVLPTLAFLFGLWAACWWIGRTPYAAEPSEKRFAWVCAAAFAALIGLFSFGWFEDVMSQRFATAVEREISASLFAQSGTASEGQLEARVTIDSHLPWQPFSFELLQRYTSERRTVMVDFTADWCPNCKVLEKAVLNTDMVKEAIEQHRVVPLIADWTEPSQEISEMLDLLGSRQIPVLAIFPADRPNEPIVLRGAYSKNKLIEKLHEASVPSVEQTAMIQNRDPSSK